MSSYIRHGIDIIPPTRNPKAAILMDPPFAPQEAPEFIGCALTFHYLNRVVNATLVKWPFPDHNWLRTPMQHAFGWLFRSRIRENPPSGGTLGFLPEAALPPDLHWAEGSPSIAGAFARFNTVIERAGEKSLPAQHASLSAKELPLGAVKIWD